MSCKCKENNKKCGCKDVPLTTNSTYSSSCVSPDKCDTYYNASCIILEEGLYEAGINPGSTLNSILQQLVLLLANPGCTNTIIGENGPPGGGITTIDLNAPTALFTLANQQVTSPSGTFDLDLEVQNQNLFFASPSGSSGTPSFRVITCSDILKQMSITCDNNGLKLVNDELSPTEQYHYGTSAATGVKGWYQNFVVSASSVNGDGIYNPRLNPVQDITTGGKNVFFGFANATKYGNSTASEIGTNLIMGANNMPNGERFGYNTILGHENLLSMTDVYSWTNTIIGVRNMYNLPSTPGGNVAIGFENVKNSTSSLFYHNTVIGTANLLYGQRHGNVVIGYYNGQAVGTMTTAEYSVVIGYQSWSDHIMSGVIGREGSTDTDFQFVLGGKHGYRYREIVLGGTKDDTSGTGDNALPIKIKVPNHRNQGGSDVDIDGYDTIIEASCGTGQGTTALILSAPVKEPSGNTLQEAKAHIAMFDKKISFPQGLLDFADDTAAAAGGILINELYRTGSVVKIRVT